VRYYEVEIDELSFMSSYSLRLEDDGRFQFHESHWDPAGQGGRSIAGTWRREGDTFFLLPLEGYDDYSWLRGHERTAVLRDYALEIAAGPTLYDPERVPANREEWHTWYNDDERPVDVTVDGSEQRSTLATGQGVRVYVLYRLGRGAFAVEERGDERAYVPSGGAEISIFWAPWRRPPDASPPAAEASEPVAERPAAAPTRVDVPADMTTDGPVVVSPPSLALAERLRRRVDEGRTAERPLGLWPLGRAWDRGGIPLTWDQFNVYALRPTGEIFCIYDDDTLLGDVETVTDRALACRLLAIGAGTYPEVAELIPPGAGVRTCDRCGGRGRTPSETTAGDPVVCTRCAGEGWLEGAGTR
jgi:hypothetical protein